MTTNNSEQTFDSRPSSTSQRISVAGIPVDLLTKESLLAQVYLAAEKKQFRIFTYANVHTANIANKLGTFRQFLWEKASVVFCDGFGLLLGARILGYKIHKSQRMTAPDFFESLAEGCSERGLSLYLLAGKPGVTDRAIARLGQSVPSLRVQGHHGFFSKTGAENDAVLAKIIEAQPDILCIGFGSPLQEQWIDASRSKLGNLVYLPLGAWLDFYTESTWRGPSWLTDNGFEWLCRLFTEPGRLWKRYLIGNPQFLLRVLTARVWKKGTDARSSNL
jgi:N-acetylglucosaminyldiphosphoundecaprenol N-acetyl-beta-D-mannosaminyltransferase